MPPIERPAKCTAPIPSASRRAAASSAGVGEALGPGGVGGLYHNHAIGVYYYGSRWAIFNQDMAPMPPGAAFNVWVAS